jgi:undecaprenyl-diphosphatase
VRFDGWVVERVEALRASAPDAFFEALSGLPLRLALLAVGLALVARLVGDRRTFAAACASTGLALIAAWALTWAVKELVGRERPFAADGDLEPLGELPDSASFPSGHASSAFAAAAVLAVFLPRWRWLPFVPAALVALSRVWLGVHYPSDVLAGALLGAGVGYAVARLAASRLGHRPDVATVDLDRGPGDVGRGRREQEGGDAAELRGLPVAPQRDPRLVAAAQLVRGHAGRLGTGGIEEPHALGVDAAGEDRVDADGGRELEREALDERRDPRAQDVRGVEPLDRHPDRRRRDEEDGRAVPKQRP